MVPDSAAPASAMFTGVKVIIVNYGQGNHAIAEYLTRWYQTCCHCLCYVYGSQGNHSLLLPRQSCNCRLFDNMVPDSAATASAMFTGVKVIIVNYPKAIILISTLKRLFHQLKICLKAYTIKSVLSVHRQSFFFIFSLSSSREN
jgi:alkaline phosphatase